MKYLVSILLLLFALSYTQGQSIERSVIASYGHHYNSNFKVDGTVGEVIVTTIGSPDLQLTQGFHQPPDDLSTNVLDQAEDNMIQLWPNPVHSDLNFEIPKKGNPSYFGIYTLEGKLIQTGNFSSRVRDVVNLSHLKEGGYFFCLFSSKNELINCQRFIKI